ncbi:MAG: prolyl oligopeptidase family serine peptidase, partial [Sciscionella sp.]
MVKIASYGVWSSPISASDVAATEDHPRFVDIRAGQVWWAQPRPADGGRVALLRWVGGEVSEVLPAPWNARNRVHEYGGRPWVVIDTADGECLVFTHWDDQRIYRLDLTDGATPRPITPMPDQPHGYRYTDLTAAPGGDAVWCVRETVTGPAPTELRRDLVSVPLSGAAAGDAEAVRALAASHHFMTAPVASNDGRHLAWVGWDHPAMPWDGTELCVAEFDGARVGPHRVLAGGPTESVCQFAWDGAEQLLVLADPDGWWNLHRVGLDGARRNLAPCQEELGGPLWMLGASWFTPLGGGRHAVLRSSHLAVLDEATGTVTDVADVPPIWSGISARDGVVVGVALHPTREYGVCGVDISAAEPATITYSAPSESHVDSHYLPVPVERVFTDAKGNRIPAYVYPPTNPDFAAPEGELPPYLVHVHGGPTGREYGELHLSFAYFTSRGIGVVTPNYGGSTGYGRAYRERLREQWGVVDVADCAAVARALVDEGTADGTRLAVRGGSAGGWTSAASLTSVSVYRCGTVMFPILDLSGWTGEGGETHDFESRYVEGLVGSSVGQRDRYVTRSPANRADQLAGPVLMLQGLEDQICPPAQADRFMAGLAGSGIPHAYLRFPGEQHGFRRSETIQAALAAELSFYGQVFGF